MAGTYFKQGALVQGTTSTATAAGTTTLTASSESIQIFTGTTTQTAKLPDATTLPKGRHFKIINQSTDLVTVQNDGATELKLLGTNDDILFTLTDNSTSNGIWSQQTGGGAGSGFGDINHIDNPTFEQSVTGWVTYADAAAADPVNGTGGSPTVTFTRSTSSPVRSNASGRLSKDAANRQGEGVSYDFSIDSVDKVIQQKVQFDYIASSNFASGDVRVWIYDVTNSTLIQPSSYVLYAQKGRFEVVWTTSSSSTSYRLIFHIASTNASAWTLDLDNVVVGPTNIIFGVNETNLIKYKTNAAQTISDSTITIIDFEDVVYDSTALVTTGGSWKFTASRAGYYKVNVHIEWAATTATDQRFLYLYKNGSLFSRLANSYKESSSSQVFELEGNDIVYLNAGDYIDVRTQQTSGGNLALTSDADENYISIVGYSLYEPILTGPYPVKYKTNAGQSISDSTLTIVDYEDIDEDPGIDFTITTGASWKATANRKLQALVVASVCWESTTAANSRAFYLYKNGSLYYELDHTAKDSQNAQLMSIGSVIVNLNAGDYIDIRVLQDSGAARVLSSDSVQNYIHITKLPSDVNLNNQGHQYDLTVTGTNWTTIRAVGVPYMTANGVWRFKFNIVGTVSVAVSVLTISITGVTFKNITNYYQAVSFATTGVSIPMHSCYCIYNTNQILADFGSNTTSDFSYSGDLELNGQPSL